MVRGDRNLYEDEESSTCMQRLKNGKRRQVPHRKRASFGGSALIVSVHQLDGLPSLRTRQVMGVFRKALAIAKDRFECRVLQFSLLSNHVHFVVEAPDEKALGRAMKGLLVRLAKGLNKLWGRKGSVFERRFDSVVVSTMRQVHRALRYVLLNARKHGIRIPFGEPDPFSSGPWFKFWKGRRQAFRFDESPVAPPRIAMLVELVCMNMPVGLDDRPGTSLECGW
jgi:REP element-mobilizing transposase RayT